MTSTQLPFDYHDINEFIPFTKPYLPNLAEYTSFLEGIWQRNWVTNNGPLLQQLEKELAANLALENLWVVNNGTIALQLAIKALGLKGEIITTPFSYVATTSSIVWEGCKPVFVDIKTSDFTIDENAIEAAITPRTSAILATHVFGNPCNVVEIQKIAKKYNLKVIYDAAHAFGTTLNGESVFKFGDISTCSLHATKLIHSIEGGFIVSKQSDSHERLRLLRNFGHNGPDAFSGVGINGKNSELHAAMGLLSLKYYAETAQCRKEQYDFYQLNLIGNKNLQFVEPLIGTTSNKAYFPLLFKDEQTALGIFNALAQKKIAARRYFYPSLNTLDYVQSAPLPQSERIASSILCLPMFHTMPVAIAESVIETVLKNA